MHGKHESLRNITCKVALNTVKLHVKLHNAFIALPVKLHKTLKNKEAMANARTMTVPVEGAIAAFHSEVKLGHNYKYSVHCVNIHYI